MPLSNMIVTETDHTRFMEVLHALDRESNAKFVFLLVKSGQQIAAAGELAMREALGRRAEFPPPPGAGGFPGAQVPSPPAG